MRILLAGVVGGLIVFIWGAVSHMATPLGHMGFAAMPPEKEPEVVAAMKDAMRERRIYFIPGADMSAEMTTEAFEAHSKKIEAGPAAFIAWEPGSGAVLGPITLATEFGFNVLESLIAAFIVGSMSSYFRRVVACTLIGLSATLTVEGSYWNWYHFPTDYFSAQLMHNTIGAFLAGLLIAKLARPT